MDPIKVVVHYIGGRLAKGYVRDFNPTKTSFHITPEGANPHEEGVFVDIREIKAIFFVKTFEGNKNYKAHISFEDGDRPQGRKCEVVFNDGEIMQGSTMGYDNSRPGFFMIPADAKSNNMRIFVVNASVKSFRFL